MRPERWGQYYEGLVDPSKGFGLYSGWDGSMGCSEQRSLLGVLNEVHLEFSTCYY